MNDAFETRMRMLSKTGLRIIDTPSPPDVPSALEAIQRVASMEVAPAVVISQNSPDAITALDRAWYKQARENSIFDSADTFLLFTAGPGGERLGWTTVQWTQTARLSPHLQDQDSPEFIAMSVDGCRLCAATTEEYDYWIVTHHFTPEAK
ncbi:hypothetical protein J7I94_09465 [Streptomyces sp. ISL-12]|uniref:hypothetical protein n=1 Tax=Streptomyces sp. ISL-12 TaxID=2819177 RepID=UPI001BE5E6B7|nr:hypothetical protein [Streptomyces sp. ISL-12]MBT2410786.1 hypothetical protein [Streptomyces sp. ISL-12]